VITTSKSPDLQQALIELFTSAVAAVASRLDSLGLPSRLADQRAAVIREKNQIGLEHVPTTRNILSDFMTVQNGAPWLTAKEIVQLNECASLVIDECASTLPFDAPPGGRQWPLVHPTHYPDPEPPDYDQDPPDWISRMLIQPALLHHLRRLGSVTYPGSTASSAFANDVINVAQADDLKYLTVVPLHGIALEETTEQVYTEGRVSIRSLLDTEQAEWWMDSRQPRLWPTQITIEPPEVLLEIRLSGPRDSSLIPPREHAATLIGAFHLHGHGVAGGVVAETADPPWVLNDIRHSGPILMPRRSVRTTILTPTEFRSVVKTAQLLDGYHLQQPRSSKELAIHRFVTGVARDSDADAVLDFTVTLESLLLPMDADARRTELSHRFRLHGAHYLANDPSERADLFRSLRDLYAMRSQLVHGSKYPQPAAIHAMRDTAHELARRGLLQAVHTGFPTADLFNQMTLGLTPS
jgi:hypothetical protein